MMYLRFAICLTACFLLANGGGWGDRLVLADGDNLSGSLNGIGNGLVMFESALAGKLFVLVEEVQSITTDTPFQVEFDNGALLTGRFTTQNGHTHLTPLDGTAVRPIRLNAIVKAQPVAERPAQEPAAEPLEKARPPEPPPEPGESPPLDAQLSLGYSWREGTSDESGPYADVRLFRAHERYQFLSDARLELTDEDSFPRLFNALAEWQFLPGEDTRPLLSIAFERDTTNALDFRGTLGAGAARSLYKDEVQELQISAQLTADFEYYDPAELETDDRLLKLERQWFIGQLLSGAITRRQSTFRRAFRQLTFLSYYAEEQNKRQEQDLSARFALDYRRDLFWNTQFMQELSVTPGLTDFGDLRAGSLSTFQFPVTPSLKLQLQLQFEYEDEIEGLGLDDWRSFLGASFAWDF